MTGEQEQSAGAGPAVAALDRFAPQPRPQEVARRRLARHLRGDGYELGPGHQPYEVPADVSVRFVDRWRPGENRDRFPELVEIGADGGFVEPDIVANFDVDRLGPVPDQSADFVICSHVLEHLAEPLGFIGEIHRVLRPGGLALILLPERTATFDRERPPTTIEHLVAEHAAEVTEVSDEHLVEFLTMAGEGASFLGIPEDETERRAFFDWHRERSIHVHCWSEDEFPDVIAHCIDHLAQGWELVDLLTVAEEGPGGIEFGYVLRRAMPGARSSGDRFLADWHTWHEQRTAIDEALLAAASIPSRAGSTPPATDPVVSRSSRRRWLRHRPPTA